MHFKNLNHNFEKVKGVNYTKSSKRTMKIHAELFSPVYETMSTTFTACTSTSPNFATLVNNGSVNDCTWNIAQNPDCKLYQSKSHCLVSFLDATKCEEHRTNF